MQKHKWLIISLVLVVFLAFFRFNRGVIQQDNYIDYARMIPGSIEKISFFDSRLLPGLPISIYLTTFFVENYYLTGYLITLLSFIGSYLLLYKITNSKLSIIPLVFPPILLNLATLIDTEFPFIFLTILGYWLAKKGRLAWAFVAIGFSVWFRLVGVAVMSGFFIYFVIQKNPKKFFTYLPYFLLPVTSLIIYNVHFFGAGKPFYQLLTYETLHPGRINIGVVQLFEDLIRAFRWGWYRILFSGLGYIILFTFLWLKSVNIKKLEFWMITGIYIFTLTVNLVPFLENLGRYLAPTVPLFWLIYHKRLKNERVFYLLIPLSFLAVLL